MTDVIMSEVPTLIPCAFEKAHEGTCGKPSTNGWCVAHEGLHCMVCEKQATHTCDYKDTGGFTCGALLCNECAHARSFRRSFRYPSRHMKKSALAKLEKEVEEYDQAL